MKFIVENEQLATALARVKSCVKASTIPILGHVLVEAKAGTVLVRATNLDREMEASIPAEVIQHGCAALPGEILCRLVPRLSKGGQCQIAIEDGRAKLVSGASKYDLRTLPIEDFPSRKELAGEAVTFSIAASTLHAMILATVYATDAKSPYFWGQGLHLHIGAQKLVAVATDSHRLARMATEIPKGSAAMPAVTVPIEAARAMADMLGGVEGEAELSVTSVLVSLSVGAVRFACKLVDCQYPDYDGKVLGRIKPTEAAATFRPYALAEAVERAAVVYVGADIAKRVPIMELATKDGAIHLKAGVAGNEQAIEAIDAETNGHGVDFTINSNYLSDMLGVWPENVAVGMSQEEASKPVVFVAAERPEQIHVIMPTAF